MAEEVVFTYGSGNDNAVPAVRVQVPKEILLLFCLLRNINEDCPSDDGTFIADIPIITDAKANPIYFTAAELDLFFELFAKEPLTIQHLEDKAITVDLLKRFLLLVNFLDNEIYLNTLSEYAAFLINAGRFTFN